MFCMCMVTGTTYILHVYGRGHYVYLAMYILTCPSMPIHIYTCINTYCRILINPDLALAVNLCVVMQNDTGGHRRAVWGHADCQHLPGYLQLLHSSAGCGAAAQHPVQVPLLHGHFFSIQLMTCTIHNMASCFPLAAEHCWYCWQSQL